MKTQRFCKDGKNANCIPLFPCRRGGGIPCGRLLTGAWLSVGLAWGAFAGDLHYTVQAGDTLTGLAGQLLDNPGDWRKVQRANGLPDGNLLRINQEIVVPGRLLKGKPAVAHVLSVTGGVSRAGEALKAGAEVREGDRLATGPDGFVSLRLADGSVLLLQPRTRAVVRNLRFNPDASKADTALELDTGRVESKVIPQQHGPVPRFRIHTPSATVGVRGTAFRVAADEQDVRTEVTSGLVQAGRGGRESVEVPRGFGVAMRAGVPLGKAVPLAPAPDLAALPEAVERVAVRVPVPAVAGAAAYRVQFAHDEAFEQLAAESLQPQPEVRTGDLPDGVYWVRVRAVDGTGLEGMDANKRLVVRARPEPPLAQIPDRGGILAADEVRFAWADVDGNSGYWVQVARDPVFAQVVAEEKPVQGVTYLLKGPLERGKYYWRLATLRPDGSAGPWGDAQSFELRPVQKGAEAPKISDTSLKFNWPGQPGQAFDFQLAKDRDFSEPLLERQVSAPEIEVPRPASGGYFIRVRARDADGYVGPYTAPQKIEVPLPTPYWLMLLLVPALL